MNRIVDGPAADREEEWWSVMLAAVRGTLHWRSRDAFLEGPGEVTYATYERRVDGDFHLVSSRTTLTPPPYYLHPKQAVWSDSGACWLFLFPISPTYRRLVAVGNREWTP